jgi:hypothetical protein
MKTMIYVKDYDVIVFHSFHLVHSSDKGLCIGMYRF